MRRFCAAAAGTVLGVLLVLRMPPSQVARRLDFIAHTNGLELARRRLLASSDRNYFYFLESARRTLPPGTAGVALSAPGLRSYDYYVAVYQLAPLPVRPSVAGLPPGWVGVFWGAPPPPEWTVVRALRGGVIAKPPAAP